MRIAIVTLGIVIAATLATGSASAGPCDTAKRGTYEFNVCWLMETRFIELTPKVLMYFAQMDAAALMYGHKEVYGQYNTISDHELTIVDSLSEENCTVTYTTLKDQNTIKFNQVNRDAIKSEWHGKYLRYVLRGRNFSSDGRREVVFASDDVTANALAGALNNLYTKFCDGLKSEF